MNNIQNNCPHCDSMIMMFEEKTPLKWCESVITPGYYTLGGHVWRCPVAIRFAGLDKEKVLQAWEDYVANYSK